MVVPVELVEMVAPVVVHEVTSKGGNRPMTMVSDENGSHSTEKEKSSQVKGSLENFNVTGK
ncbi:hypothetical protein AXX17_AT5G28750 [Arabidopsis thaliana]|uniref:Uncharacterized protein n=1 Tax=Arabidopsis thaliana TaxID=3702 RepID=A0A178US98_ARATH|nr:hypothetical protein AXX17_AT5G28750 [Arabidopsis thaliana]